VSSFTYERNDLRIYLTLMVTNCSGERSFSKLKMVESTKEQNKLKQSYSDEHRAWTSMWNRHCQYHKQIRYGKT